MVNIKKARLNNLAKMFLRALRKKVAFKQTTVACHQKKKTDALRLQILKTWIQLTLIQKAWKKWQKKQDYENSIRIYKAYVTWKKGTKAMLRWKKAFAAAMQITTAHARPV